MSDFLVLVANAGDGTVSTFRLSGEGDLVAMATSPVGEDVGTFAIDEQRDLVYAASKEVPAIVTLRLDRASGRLTPVGHREQKDNTHYIALTPEGDRLTAASYSGGYGSAQTVDDGVVSAPTGEVSYPNMHSTAIAGGGSHAYFVSLGADCIAQCALGPDGTLSPLDPPTVAAPEGSGPRHIVLDATETNVYVLTEFSAEALHYRRDTESGWLSYVGSVATYDPSKGLERSAYGRDPRADHLIWGADLHLAADGRTLYCSERTEATIATVPVDADGSLGEPLAYTPTEPQPRGFGLSPDGRWLVASGELSTTVTVYDLAGRIPAPVGRHATGNGANWVRIIWA